MDPSPLPVRNSGLAVASLVLGIIALCAGPLGFAAVILGHMALFRIKKEPGLGGGGMAIAGLIMGYLGIAAVLAYTILMVVGFRLNQAEEEAAQELFLMEEIPPPEFPALGEGNEVGDKGVVLHFLETVGSEPGQSMTFRVYLPPGQHTPATLPCVIAAPAGSNILSGLELDDSDYHDETLPYAEAGMVVINYSLDGASQEEDDDELMAASFEKFKAAGAGIVNARNAIELARQKLPMVDPNRIFSAGHSSAGTLSLLNAAHFPELAGAASYAPAVDLENHFSDLLDTPFVDLLFPGVRIYTKKFSPITHATKVQIPVFLFYARDDMMVDVEEGRTFRFAVEDAGGEVTLRTVQNGGHYQSMIDQGIPSAIEWMKQQESSE